MALIERKPVIMKLPDDKAARDVRFTSFSLDDHHHSLWKCAF